MLVVSQRVAKHAVPSASMTPHNPHEPLETTRCWMCTGIVKHPGQLLEALATLVVSSGIILQDASRRTPWQRHETSYISISAWLRKGCLHDRRMRCMRARTVCSARVYASHDSLSKQHKQQEVSSNKVKWSQVCMHVVHPCECHAHMSEAILTSSLASTVGPVTHAGAANGLVGSAFTLKCAHCPYARARSSLTQHIHFCGMMLGLKISIPGASPLLCPSRWFASE